MKTIDVYTSKMNYITTLSLTGRGIPYYDHARDLAIDGDDNGREWQDTMTLNVTLDDYNRAGIDPNGWLIWTGSDNRQYLYGITNVLTDYSGQAPFVTLTCANAFSFAMNQQHIEDKTFTGAKLADILAYIMQNSGWNLGKVDSLSNQTDDPTEFVVSGSDSAMTVFAQLVSAYRAEVRAYITIDGGIINKHVDFLRNLHFPVTVHDASIVDETADMYDYPSSGDTVTSALPSDGRTIEFRNGLAGFTRSQDNTAIYTRIWLKGKNDTTIGSANDGKDYLQDEAANVRYFGNETTFSETTLENDNIAQANALKQWGEKQLKKYNHPAYTYVITTAYARPEDQPEIGETVFIKNTDVVPEMTVLAEVIATHVSDTDPQDNTVTLGEYRTLNPTSPKSVQALLDKLKSELASDIDKAKSNAEVIRPNVLYPDGTDFDSADEVKRAIAQVYVNNDNLTAHVLPRGFVWRHITDGSQDTSKATLNGYKISLTPADVGTIRLVIDTQYLTDTPEIELDQSTATLLGQFNSSNDVIKHAAQYVQQLNDGTYITSHNDGKGNTWYVHRTAKLAAIDSMVITNGGHGASFGVDQSTAGKTRIYATTYNPNDADNYYRLTFFDYSSGAVYDQTSSMLTVLLTRPEYFRTGYDPTSNMLVVSGGDGVIDMYEASSLAAGNTKPANTVDIKQYGVNLSSQTYQSQTLRFPYLVWTTGNANGSDTPTIYAANVEHGGSEFTQAIDTTGVFNTQHGLIEPETVAFNGNNLIISFNERQTQTSGDEIQYVYSCLMKER